jgi:KRAB domain-containing zinc finger protein
VFICRYLNIGIIEEMSTAKSSKPLPSCDICGKTFHSTNSVTLHKRIHSRGQRHKCEHCHKTFIYQGTLDTHIRYTHNKGGDGILLFRCSYCERRFDTKNGLRVHISMSHYDFKRFKCEKCGERFKTSQNLTYHMYSHGAKRPAYECRLCHAKMATVKSYMASILFLQFPNNLCKELISYFLNKGIT